ncbi:MAG: calcium-binding toxin-like protein, partial [Xanthomonadaceae bacterium]|nr:calcium-binding toxin-like protein [Xanthomonadaceae bacterium]
AARAELVQFDWAGSFDQPDWEVAGTGDFDGDQLTDIFWRNRVTGNNAVGFVVRNGWESTFWYAWPTNSAVNLSWKVVGTGDFDGDGRSEVLWRNTATGANAVWRLVDINSINAFAWPGKSQGSATSTGTATPTCCGAIQRPGPTASGARPAQPPVWP